MYPVEVEGRAAQEGDTVNINYVEKLTVKNLKAEAIRGADLLLGSGRFIEGFEDGLSALSRGRPDA